MKKCRSCQEEIDDKAKKCPHCQTRQGNWAQRHPILTGILVIFFIIIISAASGGNDTSKITDSSSSQVVKTGEVEKESPAPEKIEFEVGESIQMEDYRLLVSSVKKINSKGYSTPKAGNEYVIVNVTIQNQGDDEVTYNPFDFKIQNSDGNQTTTTYIGLDDRLETGSLATGGKVTGSLVFEAPKGDENLKLIYQPNFWLDDRRITVNLQ